MKIGIVTEYFYPTLGGITENIYHFAKELIHTEHDFRIITSNAGDPGLIDPRIKNKIIHIGRRVPIFLNGSCASVSFGFKIAAKVKQVLAEEKFDIVNVHSPQFPTLPLVASMYQNCPTVGTFHTCAQFHSYHKVYYGWASPCVERLAGCIAVSNICAEENERCYGGPEYTVIPNGVDVSWWNKPRPRPEIMDEDDQWIVFLGRPDKRNGLDVLINAFRIVKKTHKRAKLLVVGDGPLLFFYKKMASDLGESVVFMGRASEDRPAYLQHADCMCFAPEIASFGITVLEGMSSKCPMVLADIEAFRGLVKDKEQALLVAPKSAEMTAKSITKLLSDRAYANKISCSAYDKVQKYDWGKVAKQTLRYYERIISNYSK